MKGPGDRVEGGPTKVFVFEYVTGGGLVGRDWPESWAIEGDAMRRAIAEDFAAVPGVQVVTTVDGRVESEESSGVDVRMIFKREGSWFESLAAEADCTVIIAPETDGILSRFTGVVESGGGRSLGSSRQAIDLVGDKALLARHFLGCDIPTPPTRLLGQGPDDLPAGWDGPIVIKPRRGAGSVDTIVVRDREFPSWVGLDKEFVVQKYLPGRPMSASFLVDSEGRFTLLGVGRQKIIVNESGRITYEGGAFPSRPVNCPVAVFAAIDSVVSHLPRPSLRGFIGVDFLLDDRGEAIVLEINPRATTSYVGLVRMFPAGVIAGAWIAACSETPALGWLDRLKVMRDHPAITFDSDGTTWPASGDDFS